jgi:hypothetical protein
MTDCVYVFSNPSMPGIVKIGMTKNGEKGVEKRRKDLSSATGSPKPFVCEGFVATQDGKAMERKAHTALRDKRISRNREFFKVTPKVAIGLLKGLKSQELPPEKEFRIDFRAFRVYREVLSNSTPSAGRITVKLLSVFHSVLLEIYEKKVRGAAAKILLEAARLTNSETSRVLLEVAPLFCLLADLVDQGYFRHDQKGWFFSGTEKDWEQVQKTVYGGLP